MLASLDDSTTKSEAARDNRLEFYTPMHVVSTLRAYGPSFVYRLGAQNAIFDDMAAIVFAERGDTWAAMREGA
jgi:hypothetical protein